MTTTAITAFQEIPTAVACYGLPSRAKTDKEGKMMILHNVCSHILLEDQIKVVQLLAGVCTISVLHYLRFIKVY